MDNQLKIEPAVALSELLLELARRVDAAANASPLKPAQWAALRYLSRAPQSARTNKAFSSYHHTTTGTVAVTFKTLAEKGLVSRSEDPKDKRSFRFDLTEAGQELLKSDPIGILVEAVSSLSEQQRQNLTEILTALLLDQSSGS